MQKNYTVHAIALNSNLNYLYASVDRANESSIYAITEQKQQAVLDNMHSVEEIAVDWITNNVYYIAHGTPSNLLRLLAKFNEAQQELLKNAVFSLYLCCQYTFAKADVY